MHFTFHYEARIEFLEAIEYYENCSSGLGLEFSEEVFSSIQQIIMFPLACSPLSKNTRRCLIRRFPYGIIYATSENRISILAIMHLNKKPNYWQKRVRKEV